jgi:penicillin amidase
MEGLCHFFYTLQVIKFAMRYLLLFLTAAITVALCYILDTRTVLPAPLGRLLAPQQGFWQNAEPSDADFSADLHFNKLEGNATVYFDERLVPHIFAEKENDAYFVQGFLHAKFRLWQMELQTLSAAGRISEIVGDVALDHDREFRSLGMVYAAEIWEKEMEKDAPIKQACDAYTAGVNAYITTLNSSNLPLEYKLLGYEPELWSNLKTGLFLKYMAYDLAAHENDFEMTNALAFFKKSDFNALFPSLQDSLDPIIPKGTVFSPPAVVPVAPKDADSVYFHQTDTATAVENTKPEKANGSNNWAVSGSKTKSGAPILCNDPHLGLNLPSLWYEIQLSVPGFNAYGASFPGSPGVIIGFNDSCAFGFTNGGRDVRDYYEIIFKNQSKTSYWYDSSWKPTSFRIEKIKIAGKPDFIDTVAYTVFGPVMYDNNFSGKRNTGSKNYAVRWTAHDPSNEMRLFYDLNHAKNYNDYLQAAPYLKTPGQNCVFAAKNGDIAIRTQGNFPAKWKGQGDFIMPGTDSRYAWQGMIPQNEIPFQYNPERGFVSSANQRPVDSTYPYYLGRDYPTPRGLIINRKLSAMQQITPKDMMLLQTDNYNVFAEMAVPVILKNLRMAELSDEEKAYAGLLQNWNYRSETDAKGPTVFDLAWKYFSDTVYFDEYANAPEFTERPLESTLLEGIIRDSAFRFVDDIRTNELETLPEMVTRAFKKAVVDIKKADKENRLAWGKYKDTRVNHLLRLPAFSQLHVPIGGGTNIINATTETHGPSWRMIVSLTPETEAYGIYPGGQSGNPGSRFYDNAISKWAAGEYYSLWMMKPSEQKDQRVKWKMQFSKS